MGKSTKENGDLKKLASNNNITEDLVRRGAVIFVLLVLYVAAVEIQNDFTLAIICMGFYGMGLLHSVVWGRKPVVSEEIKVSKP
jgi:hypothetical protein